MATAVKTLFVTLSWPRKHAGWAKDLASEGRMLWRRELLHFGPPDNLGK